MSQPYQGRMSQLLGLATPLTRLLTSHFTLAQPLHPHRPFPVLPSPQEEAQASGVEGTLWQWTPIEVGAYPVTGVPFAARGSDASPLPLVQEQEITWNEERFWDSFWPGPLDDAVWGLPVDLWSQELSGALRGYGTCPGSHKQKSQWWHWFSGLYSGSSMQEAACPQIAYW